MSLDDLANQYHMRERVKAIIHGGAHLAEEAVDYRRVFTDAVPVLWIEANPRVIPQIQNTLSGGSYYNQSVVCGLITNVDDSEMQFNVTNHDGMSSSVFEFGTHPQFSPETIFTERVVMRTRTLDSIVAEYCGGMPPNMLVLDIQGAELMALQGATNLLTTLDFAMLEINKDDVYIGCAKVWDLDDILLTNGLRRMETYWVPGQGWGDALWVRV